MRILPYLFLIFTLADPALAQQTVQPEGETSADFTEVRLITGAEHIKGEVGDGLVYETTYARAGVALTSGRLSASASIPYISTSAPEELIVSQGGVLGTPLFAPTDSELGRVTREGIGDLSLNLAYLLPLSGIDVTIAGTVKVPKASREKGLGTGKVDYGVSGRLSKRVGSVTPFVAGGYTIVGELEEFELRNTFAAKAGSHLLLGKTTSLTGFYSYEQAASPRFGDNQSLGIGLSTSLSNALRVGIEGTAGLSEEAPDARIGLSIGIGL